MDSEWMTREVFHYEIPGEASIIFDVTRAKKLAAESANVVAEVDLTRDAMAEIAERNTWDREHAAQADPGVPGIGAPLINDGHVQYILIDGLHRNARALELGVGFRARLLTDDAARACVLTGPHPRIP